MKKRIIAAMTALVMVVTMIPSTAFGYDWQPSQVADLIYQATAQGAGSALVVPYNDIEKKAIKDAKEAYASLDLTEKAAVNAESETMKHYDSLLVAEAIYNHYGEAIAEYNAALKGFKKGILDTENSKTIVNGTKIVTPELNRIDIANDAVTANAKIDIYLKDGETVVVPNGTAVTKIPAKFRNETPVTFDKTTVLSSCLTADYLDANALAAKAEVEKYYGSTITEIGEATLHTAVAAVNEITKDTVANLVKDPKPTTKEALATEKVEAAKAAIEATIAQDAKWGELVKYAKNYTTYVTALEKYNSFKVPEKVADEIAAAEALIDGKYDAVYVADEDTSDAADELEVWGVEKEKTGTIVDAKLAVANAKVVYNKYKTTYKDEVVDLGNFIKAAQKNIDRCESALAIKNELVAYGEPTHLSKDQAVAILNIDNDKVFTHDEKLDNLDRH